MNTNNENLDITKEILNNIEEIFNYDNMQSVMEMSYYKPDYKDSLLSNSRVLIIYLLKMIYQPEKQSSSWVGTIIESFRIVYTKLVDEKGNLQMNELNKLIKKFDNIIDSSISYAAEEMSKDVNDIELTYGIGIRSFLSKEWIVYFMKNILIADRLRKNTLSDDSKFMVTISNLPNINKYDINRIDNMLGKVEIYD